MSKALEQLKDYLKKKQQIEHVLELIFWDMETVMPKNGFARHSDVLTDFSTEEFKLSTSDELKGYLHELNKPEEYEKLDDMWKFIVKRMKRDIDRDSRIPEALYTEYVQKQAEASQAWKEAKNASDYSIFAPHLNNLIELTKKITAYTDPDKEIYDALLNQYEEGMDSESIDRIFNELKSELLPLLDRILEAGEPDDSKFHREYDVDDQRKVQKLLLDYIGFDWDRGAVGETEHPFTTNFSSQDVRITNHFYADNAIDPMFSAIHEGGHAIFEQNVNPDYDGTVAGSCGYMGVHESQSRFFENILGRNKNFWIPIYGQVQELIPEFADVTLDEFVREINHVKNSYIRTMADEVTYCLHIILRYEMEKAIFRDNVSVDELPAMWNNKMEEYLHITPRNDAEGILQDSHWSGGSFGYFPSYLLGSIYDGMFLEKIEEELGDIDTILAEGRILEITKWLNENIHVYGTTRTPKQVIAEVCGKELSAKPLMKYFTKKYTQIYNL